MTTAAPIASRGTSAHLPAGLVVLHPARTASASTVSARTVQGRSRVTVSSQSVRSSRAAHAPRPAQVAQTPTLPPFLPPPFLLRHLLRLRRLARRVLFWLRVASFCARFPLLFVVLALCAVS